MRQQLRQDGMVVRLFRQQEHQIVLAGHLIRSVRRHRNIQIEGAGYGRAEAIQRVDVIFVGIEQIDRLAALGDQRADDCAEGTDPDNSRPHNLSPFNFIRDDCGCGAAGFASGEIRTRGMTSAVFARARGSPARRLNASDASSIHSPCGKARNATLPMSSAYRNMANVYGRMSWNLTL